MIAPPPALGSMENPAELEIGENSVEIEAGSNGYYYTWTAEEDGVLTVTMYSENWFYVVNNMTSGKYGDSQFSDWEECSAITEIEVAAGDEIQLVVKTYDPEAPWAAPAGTFTFDASFAGVPGKDAENPIYVEWEWNEEYTGATATVTLGTGTWYFADWALTGMELTVNGEAYEYVPGAPRQSPATFIIVNEGEEADYALEMIAPPPALGSMENPAELEIGENTAHPGADGMGYHFTWTATADGELTITMSGDNWTYVINNMTSYAYGENHASNDTPVVTSETVNVSAGDEIAVVMGTTDWTAADIAFTASFEAKVEEGPCTHKKVTHVEAVAPTCENEGNIEYWYCEECVTVWTDEGLTQLTNFKNVIVPATGKHDVKMEEMVWSWSTALARAAAADKVAVATVDCADCDEDLVLYATVSVETVLYKDAKYAKYDAVTTIHYYTATVTYEGQTYTNKCTVVDPTCFGAGYTEYFGKVERAGKVYDYGTQGSGNVLERVAKLKHEIVTDGTGSDAKTYCKVCGTVNPSTGDMIMISVVVMVLAGAAMVFLLSKKRRIA